VQLLGTPGIEVTDVGAGAATTLAALPDFSQAARPCKEDFSAANQACEQ